VKTAAVENPIQHSANTMAEVAFGLYGLSKLSSYEPIEDSARLKDGIAKLATVGAIEGLLSLVPNTLSEDATKLAAELRALNRHYGAKLLHELTEKTAQVLIVQKPEAKPGSMERAAKQQTGGTLESAAEKVQEESGQ
jgi:hypothetical protein